MVPHPRTPYLPRVTHTDSDLRPHPGHLCPPVFHAPVSSKTFLSVVSGFRTRGTTPEGRGHPPGSDRLFLACPGLDPLHFRLATSTGPRSGPRDEEEDGPRGSPGERFVKSVVTSRLGVGGVDDLRTPRGGTGTRERWEGSSRDKRLLVANVDTGCPGRGTTTIRVFTPGVRDYVVLVRVPTYPTPSVPVRQKTLWLSSST